jgi:hypothetical protein
MPKTVDFLAASKRHYEDAEQLTNSGRIPNAGQLFGFAAECGLKALLVSHGLNTDPNTGDIIEPRPHKYKTHVDMLINHIDAFSARRNFIKYLAMMPSLPTFSDWRAEHRYFDAAFIPLSHAHWYGAAKEIRIMLDQAKLDGVIA